MVVATGKIKINSMRRKTNTNCLCSIGLNHLYSKNTKVNTISKRRINSHTTNEIIMLAPKLAPNMITIILGESISNPSMFN